MDRQRVSARQNPLGPLHAALAEGRSLIIFPEGPRGGGEEGEVGTFKPGLWHLGRKHPGVEMVPVHLENLNRILPKGEVLAVPLLAAVVFGRPVEWEADREGFLLRARRAVEELCRKAEGR
jgi:1-acyl-sn-glycerol-3-phosphate acyltransferase